ncbi:cytochrome c maturation protein CcmE [Thalassomonas actiniarum]|uniref:Cytochrome c-type biogenesis protein CcmE n=1 Tax=Thalassomonas actiniarum TaxID=485447 RepID=A0AAF0C3G4_9GAMM|nr:cytochrome c maturation protein CcmE [Thalassomonas actiniarum]WDD98664.1 cytochrome c maturation protein CcmE [Thalassomonas actiniarum]
MNPRRKKRLTIVSSILLGLAVVAGLVLYALSQNIDLFYTPKEILQGKEDTELRPVIGQRLRIGGLVVPGSVKRNEDSLKVSFKLADMRMPMVFNENDPMVTVHYDGILPDLFREGQGIVANGVLTSEAIIDASEVLAKHDENYMPPELADAMKEGNADKAMHGKSAYNKG